VIVDAQAADGDVIWQPDSSTVADTGIGRFTEFLRVQGLEIGHGYDEIWQWSVDEPEQFWTLFAQFARVRLGGSDGPVRSPDAMPLNQLCAAFARGT